MLIFNKKRKGCGKKGDPETGELMKTQLKVFRKARKIKFRRRLSRRNMLDRKETEIPEEC